ncbi:hypothetical protein AKJ16_DCAP13987 [Drosera capensis]
MGIEPKIACSDTMLIRGYSVLVTPFRIISEFQTIADIFCLKYLSPTQKSVANPEKRITIEEIKLHPWFLKNLL